MTAHAPAGGSFAARRAAPAAALALALAFVAVGMLGTYRYLRGYWLYRGFPPPSDPAFVTSTGRTDTISVTSAALGGRAQQVIVYLPPGYDEHPARRYATLYLLHGFPGRPAAFLETVRMGVVEDILVERRRAQPMILVMPWGSTGTFTDKEWANGSRPNEGWGTFVAHDLVHAIDGRYRTIAAGRARAIAGLSEGGYGALNIGLQHPGEFRVLESWSGYEKADPLKAIFGTDQARIRLNSPLHTLPFVARTLRRNRDFVWFYSGSDDRLRRQNDAFAALLAHLRVPHEYFVVRGGHNWAVWRGTASRAYLAAESRLTA
jgi:enterochelin esterase-like enzyme